MPKQPNFLLFITDQMRADHLGCYGNRVVRTSAIDAIARGGVAFDRFYVANPACMPNRAAMVTGRMPSANGVRCNGIPLSLTANTFIDLMRLQGWQTAAVGKIHLQTMTAWPPVQRPDYGDRRAPPAGHGDADLIDRRHPDYMQEAKARWETDPDHDLKLPFYGFEHVDLTAMHADDVHGHYGRWLAARHPDPKSLIGRANSLPFKGISDFQAWRTRVPEELYSTSYIAERTEAFLRSHAAGGEGRPFLLQCSFNDPHHPFTPPGKYFDMYDPADIELPASFASTDDEVPPPVRLLRRLRDEGRNDREGWTIKAVAENDVRQAIALTYGAITMIDDAIARILRVLEETGQAEDTVIIFTSDHGDFMGDHQLILKGPLHYDGLVRVPFIWNDPQTRQRGGERSATLGSTIDIASTILSRAGLAPYHDMQGVDLAAASGPEGTGAREALLIEEDNQRAFLGFDRTVRLRTLVTDRWRFSLYRGVPWGELYDLRDDPTERHNLWDDPAARPVRDELTARLLHTVLHLQPQSPLPVGQA
ncbi:sulfatase-like hydrolase/transferase [Azospirillum sp. RWY-5-1]|uniref:Sulfatase-like hydrolase/transferase n=1 Tax=Azospirillum oleiclasticum TaxID=2735135 RepID=A0ABX2T9T9_9PROT|nr:sulfatase-like hydrolase/transferase [Azospirillum oleiclasticum]NYZ20934.1 sulfatase-like hydrolase/transferase [Azospirillum oleiclasticum]